MDATESSSSMSIEFNGIAACAGARMNTLAS